MSKSAGSRRVAATSPPSESNASDLIDRLVGIADRGLPTMMLPSGLSCFDLDTVTGAPRGESVRYSLIVLLGLARRAQAGGQVSVPIAPLVEAIELRRSEMGAGDLALRLWAHVRLGSDRAEKALADLGSHLGRLDSTSGLAGLEIGWWVIAAALAKESGLDADRVLNAGVETLRQRRSRRSPLVRHLGAGWRAAYPNFATQIYSLLALAELARLDLLDEATRWALDLADLLVELRHPDHGWSWLYHTESASVVEPYEIYSVHQDGMAPMAFLTLAGVTGRKEYASAALEGIPWCFGANDLGISLVNDSAAYVNRSIRRQGWAKRANLYGNTFLAGSRLHQRVSQGALEINETCRPYHLGWILEAFSGRDDLLPTADRNLP